MTVELTAEQIVTKLIASNEIVTPSKCAFVTMHSSLGEYLKNLPKDKNNILTPTEQKKGKYSFIRNVRWKF